MPSGRNVMASSVASAAPTNVPAMRAIERALVISRSGFMMISAVIGIQ